jgi:lipopolysaccharide/colanic/teichoic acid biosynthesis glycosyltransferase
MQHHTKRWSTILTERDKRITKIGRILRRFKIDELPQLINIIKGEMSFVGPRPQVLEDTKNNTKLWKEAFKVKPGITGLATLLYHNREYKLLENAEKKGKSKQEVFISKIMPQKLKLNIFYVKKQNICLDIKILWWTFQDLFLKKILKRKRKKPL